METINERLFQNARSDSEAEWWGYIGIFTREAFGKDEGGGCLESSAVY